MGSVARNSGDAPVVTIFGSSSPKEGSKEWEQAERLGALLVSNGFNIVNGGYGGTMEASAKGASAAVSDRGSQISIVGVTCPPLFPWRKDQGNQFLTEKRPACSLIDRIEQLIASGDVFVVLPGQLGTLTELALVWNICFLEDLLAANSGQLPEHYAEIPPQNPPAKAAGHRRIYAFRDPWEKALHDLGQALNIPKEHHRRISFVDSPEDCVHQLLRDPFIQSRLSHT